MGEHGASLPGVEPAQQPDRGDDAAGPAGHRERARDGIGDDRQFGAVRRQRGGQPMRGQQRTAAAQGDGGDAHGGGRQREHRDDLDGDGDWIVVPQRGRGPVALLGQQRRPARQREGQEPEDRDRPGCGHQSTDAE